MASEEPGTPINPLAGFSVDLRAYARTIVKQPELEHIPEDRRVVLALMAAMFDAVRDEWDNSASLAGLTHELSVARKLMARDGYGPDRFPQEPIVGPPHMQSMPFCRLDDKQLFCFDVAIAPMLPLSAYYTNKIQEAIDFAADVGALIAAEQDKGNEGAEREHQEHQGIDAGAGVSLAGPAEHEPAAGIDGGLRVPGE